MPGMGIYLVEEINDHPMDAVNPIEDLDGYPYESGWVTTYENENIEAFIVYNWNGTGKGLHNEIGLTTNVVGQDALHQVSIYGLDPCQQYDILLFDINGKVYYQGSYKLESPVFPSVCVPSIRPGLFYLHLSNAEGGINTFKIAVLE